MTPVSFQPYDGAMSEATSPKATAVSKATAAKAAAQPGSGAGLSERDAALLDFEESWWAADGTKEAEIRARFDLSVPRYYQILNALLDDPAALEHQPLLVKRLRRLRQRRHESRSARHLSVKVGL